MGGRERRRIALACRDATTATGWLEDDFHHFGITIRHDGARVTDVAVATPRYPYSTCATAGDPLKALVGAPLVKRSTDIGAFVDMRAQCTHLFDLAGLIMAQAALARADRLYEATVEDREIVNRGLDRKHILGAGSASLSQDGVGVLCWTIDGMMITGPQDWAGQSLNEGFRERTEAMPIEQAEYATILRRTIMIANGRAVDRATHPLPRAQPAHPAVCHTFQPGRREYALWVEGSQLNWEESGQGMLALRDQIP